MLQSIKQIHLLDIISGLIWLKKHNILETQIYRVFGLCLSSGILRSFLEYRTMDRDQKPVILSVIHHHQNALKSISEAAFVIWQKYETRCRIGLTLKDSFQNTLFP
jgi:hypothetical protein